MVDRHQRCVQLQEVLRVWLVTRSERSIGAYWPIKGEFDALPALFRWSEVDPLRRIGLPVINRDTRQLRFHVWYPGCPMEEDAYGIPKPKDTELPLAALSPRPFTVGIGFAHGQVPWLQAEPHDAPLDAMLIEDGVVWQRE